MRSNTIVPGHWPARIVQTIAGASTDNSSDILIDSNGARWRRVSEAEASILRSGTAPASFATIHPDGTIR